MNLESADNSRLLYVTMLLSITAHLYIFNKYLYRDRDGHLPKFNRIFCGIE
jgi:hypothetical protein